MATPISISQNGGEWTVRFDVDISAAGAVSAVRGDGITVTKTGTGTYTVQVNRINFYEVLERCVQLHSAVGVVTAKWASITAVALSQADLSLGALITITVWDDNATPVAADPAAACILSGHVTFREWKQS